MVGRLSAAQREELFAKMKLFLAEKRFEGCGGQQITDEIKVTIAAQACLLLLGRKTKVYPRLKTILVYPHAYESGQKGFFGGDNGAGARLGESWASGAVVLAWDSVKSGARNMADGHNVTFHEFAHQLDQEDGVADGAPILPEPSAYATWAHIFNHEYDTLVDMKAVFLGTGTSHGIPMIGCDCRVCRSENSKNHRRRCSLYVVADKTHLVFDTPPDFRDQAITFGVKRVDAVFLTHIHADHIFGFDDIRRFSALQENHIPVYGSPETMAQMRIKFDYVENASHSFGGVPRVRFIDQADPVKIGKTSVTPLPVWHGNDNRVYGYRIDCYGKSLAYVPDCSSIPKKTFQALENLDVMILDALRPKQHPTHLSISESTEILRKIGAKRSFVTHLAHDSDHDELQAGLKNGGITVPWDGLEVVLP